MFSQNVVLKYQDEIKALNLGDFIEVVIWLDGNCYYRAILFAIGQNQEDNMKLKESIVENVDEMYLVVEEIRGDVDMTRAKYLENINRIKHLLHAWSWLLLQKSSKWLVAIYMKDKTTDTHKIGGIL